jgi:Zn finger protein HypA/HybF involved in hydrogenase expression
MDYLYKCQTCNEKNKLIDWETCILNYLNDGLEEEDPMVLRLEDISKLSYHIVKNSAFFICPNCYFTMNADEIKKLKELNLKQMKMQLSYWRWRNGKANT